MKQASKKHWYNFLLPRVLRRPVQQNPASLIADPAAIPLEWEEKEAIKEAYSSGREYFLFAGDIDPRRHQLLVLLKAFSRFKKWQQSEMKLIIAGKITKRTGELEEKLASYKYKQDALILREPEQALLLKLTAAAYTFVYLDNKDIFPVTILNAIQSQVPVIACNTPDIGKIMAGQGVLVPADDPEELAKKLLLVYKDEAFRATLIQKRSAAT